MSSYPQNTTTNKYHLSTLNMSASWEDMTGMEGGAIVVHLIVNSVCFFTDKKLPLPLQHVILHLGPFS